MAKSTKVNLKEATFAGVWLRFVALIIDGLIMSPFSAPAAIIAFKAGFRAAKNITPGEKLTVVLSASEKKMLLVFGLGGLIINATYQILMNSSKWQGTIGKGVLGLKIVDENGQRITTQIAVKRYFAQNWAGVIGNLLAIGNPVGSMVQMMNNISGVYFVVDAVIGGTDEKKRTIHDRAAGTYVVTKK